MVYLELEGQMVPAGNAVIDNVFEFRAAGMEMIVQPAEAGMPLPGEPALAQVDDSKVPEFVFFIYDHLGNTRVMYSNNLVDCDPAKTEYLLEHVIDYYPYAKTLREYVYERERFQSTYHERDEETGLDYRGARFYDSDVGRFLSVDPLAHWAPDWTPYRYAFNNPVLYIDPFGLFETRREARDFKKEKNIKGSVRRDGDSFYVQERGEGGGQYAFGSEASGYGTAHTTANPEGEGTFDQVSHQFWDLMRAGDRWAQGEGGQSFAQGMADLNPLVSGANAFTGFRDGQNIYGQQIGNGEASVYAASVLPIGKAATGLKLLGGGTLLSGIIPVSKKAFKLPVGLGGSKRALLSTVLAFKLGLRGSLGRKVPTLIGPSASSLETAIGRNAIPIGGGMIGAGFLLDELEKE